MVVALQEVGGSRAGPPMRCGCPVSTSRKSLSQFVSGTFGQCPLKAEKGMDHPFWYIGPSAGIVICVHIEHLGQRSTVLLLKGVASISILPTGQSVDFDYPKLL